MLLIEDQRLKIVTRAFWLFDVHFGGPNENTVVFSATAWMILIS